MPPRSSLQRAALAGAAALTLTLTPAARAGSDGFALDGVDPSPVTARMSTEVTFEVTAPAGAAATTFTLHRNDGRASRPNWNAALRAPETAAPFGLAGGIDPTLAIEGVRVDGPGTITQIPQSPLAIAHDTCLREGVGAWVTDGRYRLDLPAGQSTRVVVQVSVPPGVYGRPPVLQLIPTAWAATSPGGDAPTSGASGAPITATIERARSATADLVAFVAGRTAKGRYAVRGRVFPPRARAKVEIIGAKAASDPQLPFQSIEQALDRRPKVLGRATTNAKGDFRTTITVTKKLSIAARTDGSAKTVAGASCAIAVTP